MECIKRTNPSNLIVEIDNNRSERELYAAEMSVTNDATPTNYNRMLEDIDLSLFKTHTVVTHHTSTRETKKCGNQKLL